MPVENFIVSERLPVEDYRKTEVSTTPDSPQNIYKDQSVS
jgi:hypothetical protein